MEQELDSVIKKSNLFTLVFPAILMTLITMVCHYNMNEFNGVDYKGISILSLVLLFPLLFLVQGIVSAKTNTNIFLSLGISTIDFILLMAIYLNFSAWFYTVIYLLFGIIGYALSKRFSK